MVTHILRQGRAAFLRKRYLDRCVIVRPGLPVDDGQGGVIVTQTVIYEGPCYAEYPGIAFESKFEVAGAGGVQARNLVRVPFGVVFRPGDVVTIISSPTNPQLAGTVLRVASIDDQSQATAQRLLCEDNQAGVAT